MSRHGRGKIASENFTRDITIATIAVGSLPTFPKDEQRAEQDEHCAEQEQTQQGLDAHEALRGANNRGVPGAVVTPELFTLLLPNACGPLLVQLA
jgi:hypothetical protein